MIHQTERWRSILAWMSAIEEPPGMPREDHVPGQSAAVGQGRIVTGGAVADLRRLLKVFVLEEHAVKQAESFACLGMKLLTS